jgi:hypothetical protein
LSWLPSEDAARIGGGAAYGARIRRAPRSGRCHQSRLPSKEGVVARKEGGVVDGVVPRFRVGHSMVSGARAGACRSSGERARGRGLQSEPWCLLRPLWEHGAEDCRAGCTRWRIRGAASRSLGRHRGEEAARAVSRGQRRRGYARASRGRAQCCEGGGGGGRGTGIAAAETRARAGVASRGRTVRGEGVWTPTLLT